ncbi:hypothetical protein GXM_00143 [Nostoc sphaeroides CCNUC1]|uniref:Uncharacterized protein n=1 Tax=Nostoc sphaeroides CCNUC1 TaxID=2653204 RepID=A0A5P8VQP9_9NOSO|nr:hypothetical protein GXM_00143 [Nostoc sphaeroides CCNUC1]
MDGAADKYKYRTFVLIGMKNGERSPLLLLLTIKFQRLLH